MLRSLLILFLMLARGSGCVTSKPDTNDKTNFHKQSSAKRVSGEKTSCSASCKFRVPKRLELSPVRFLKHVSDKVVSALNFLSRRRRSSPSVPSSGRSNPSIAPIDSHRAEAINDCIEFINSSSLQRTNYTPASSC